MPCITQIIKYHEFTTIIGSLDFQVDPSGPIFDLVVSLPLTIGTIPLQEYMKTLTPPAYQPDPPYSTEQFGLSDPSLGWPPDESSWTLDAPFP